MITEQGTYKLLLHGIDTVQCAYYLTPPPPQSLDFRALAVIKEQLRMNKSREPRAVKLGDTEFFIHPYGSSSGFPFVLSNEDFKIELGSLITLPCFVTYRSQALYNRLQPSMPSLQLGPRRLAVEMQQPESLSRVDFCFDYSLVRRD
ncbi:MAG: hypothetical protein IPO99_14245 [Nitrospira sp.]|nr:hypothetical protein [Nitrospira sp.]